MQKEQRRRTAGLIIMAVVGMLAFVSLLGAYTTALDAFEVRLSVAIFDGGYTQLEVPPLGRVRARTHLPPLLLKATLTNINLQQLETVIAHSRDEVYLTGLQAAARRKVLIFLSRLLLLAFLGGVAGPYFLGERNRKRLLAAGITGSVLFSILLAGAYFTFSPAAFLNPEFEGILEAAPWMFGLVEEALFHVSSLGEQLELVAESINNLFTVVDRLEALGTAEGDLKVAHISDLHNNPAGMDFVRQVIAAFNVSLVIDTGDITDFGTEIEAGLAAPLAGFGIPYLFIPGNHDAPDVIARMNGIPNVIVLEEGTVEINGLRIA
ncbi:MAG TPA: metallophosphoesterase, partial [Firmicutes bacterium]|nr:metallophosphoesterase [Bacillota bacterium]